MSEETRELVADEPPEYAGIRPTGHYLMLLLRAAVVDDGHGGPWLYVYRTRTAGGALVYTHHLSTSVTGLDAYSENRAVMLSGDEALGFAAEHRWPSITDPTVAELRALGTYAVQVERIDQWAEWHSAWIPGHVSRRQARAERAARARAAARGLRWVLAEQWLQIPTE